MGKNPGRQSPQEIQNGQEEITDNVKRRNFIKSIAAAGAPARGEEMSGTRRTPRLSIRGRTRRRRVGVRVVDERLQLQRREVRLALRFPPSGLFLERRVGPLQITLQLLGCAVTPFQSVQGGACASLSYSFVVVIAFPSWPACGCKKRRRPQLLLPCAGAAGAVPRALEGNALRRVTTRIINGDRM